MGRTVKTVKADSLTVTQWDVRQELPKELPQQFRRELDHSKMLLVRTSDPDRVWQLVPCYREEVDGRAFMGADYVGWQQFFEEMSTYESGHLYTRPQRKMDRLPNIHT